MVGYTFNWGTKKETPSKKQFKILQYSFGREFIASSILQTNVHPCHTNRNKERDWSFSGMTAGSQGELNLNE